MNKEPLVSVIITAYNAQKFIGQAIQSILKQTYRNMEIIVVDDGSTDNTYNILKSYADSDSRIKLYKMKANRGPSIASNFALRITKGDFIARMDADDIALSNRIEKQVRFLLQHSDVAIVGGQCYLIDENGKKIGKKRYPLAHKDIYASLYIINPIQHPACTFRGDLIRSKNLSYRNHSLLAHDLELLFEIAQYGKLANLADTVLYYRQHRNSLSLRNPKQTFKATVNVRKKAIKHYGYNPTLMGLFAHYCQFMLLFLLPNNMVYSFFQFLRIKRNLYIPLAYRFLGSLL